MKNIVILFLLVVPFLDASEPKILFEADASSLITHVSIVLLKGSSHDPIDKVGLNNFYTELILRGTKKKSRSEFQSALERMGASLSVHSGQDKTIFDGRVIKENTAAFFKLLLECLIEPAFSKKEFESLKTEILAETLYIKNVNNRLGGLVARRELFAGSSLESTVSGRLSTIKNITLKDVAEAYENDFKKGSFIFALSSALTEAELKNEIMQIWNRLPEGSINKLPIIIPKAPTEPKLIVIHKPKTSTGALIFAQSGITAQDPDRYAFLVGNFSFGGEPLVSRLFRIIRGELGWTYAIGTTYMATGGLNFQPGMYIVSSTPSVEFTVKTIIKLQLMWEEYLERGLKSEELKLAQDSLVNSYPFEFDSAEKRLGQRLYSFLNEVPTLSDEEYAKTIRNLDNDDIKKALKKHGKTSWIMALVADKDVIAKQLEEEQKDTAPEKRVKISKVLTPDEVIL